MMSPLAPLLLAFRPFIDPLPIGNSSAWVALFIPLVILVSVAYKTIKLRDLRELPRKSAILALQIFIFMGAAAAGLWVLTLFA
ncbi:hypothetical protein [Algisphaera agarilytica]|uniref:Uncharacterized protein n=1 Tax=Algisphaera agarilytica TaxID=1385975 RepID=A0A7X0H8Y3_9BACT|nr:hypothetical protein [Algisphaera agarilytica]MBB6429984.1 hypothetical protein [Algisphaera agarilytica]